MTGVNGVELAVSSSEALGKFREPSEPLQPAHRPGPRQVVNVMGDSMLKRTGEAIVQSALNDPASITKSQQGGIFQGNECREVSSLRRDRNQWDDRTYPLAELV